MISSPPVCGFSIPQVHSRFAIALISSAVLCVCLLNRLTHKEQSNRVSSSKEIDHFPETRVLLPDGREDHRTGELLVVVQMVTHAQILHSADK